MTSMTSPSSASITTSVVINARPEVVWRFLSDQNRLLAWITYLPGAPTPPGSVFEPRSGGTLKIVFPNKIEARGQVVEVDPPHRLVFTWGYEPDLAKTGLRPGSCRVEVALQPVPGGTRVTLTHSGPMSEETARAHEGGWRHYLSQLALQASQEAHQAHLAGSLRAWFDAWNQPDDAAREQLLASCCAPDVHLRTPFNCADGLTELSAAIASGLRHMPGVTLAQNGVVRHLHGYARVPWKVGPASGKPMFTGENFVAFDPDGKITGVVGFAEG
jgi:uncharacterized protein YndB with AHSA1/START domain